MSLGVTRGELLLVAFIFALVYVAGLLPKIAARLGGRGDDANGPAEPSGE